MCSTECAIYESDDMSARSDSDRSSDDEESSRGLLGQRAMSLQGERWRRGLARRGAAVAVTGAAAAAEQ